MSVEVKICGIRTLEAAQTAVDAEASFLGFNFVPSSKRYIEPDEAKKIIDQIRGVSQVVGVFQNAAVEEVNEIASKLGLDFVQLHGSESPEYVNQIKVRVIKAFSLSSDLNSDQIIVTMDRYSVPLYLLDREKQGQGAKVNLKKAHELAKLFPLFISGGLTPDNVAEVIKVAKPYGVDVAGGVETNGVQDLKKIKAFIKNTQEAE